MKGGPDFYRSPTMECSQGRILYGFEPCMQNQRWSQKWGDDFGCSYVTSSRSPCMPGRRYPTSHSWWRRCPAEDWPSRASLPKGWSAETIFSGDAIFHNDCLMLQLPSLSKTTVMFPIKTKFLFRSLNEQRTKNPYVGPTNQKWVVRFFVSTRNEN